MKRVLRILIDIFQPEGIDWMNFAVSKNNPYTYHHIVEKCNGGEKNIDNGAILTKKAHTLLNLLEIECPEAYQDLNNIFARINGTKRPVTQKTINEIDEILYDIFVTDSYGLGESIDLSPFYTHYHKGRRIAKRYTK